MPQKNIQLYLFFLSKASNIYKDPRIYIYIYIYIMAEKFWTERRDMEQPKNDILRTNKYQANIILITILTL